LKPFSLKANYMDNLNLSGSPAPATTPQEFENSYYESARPALEAEMRSGANWFYWIAGLSLVNTVISLVGANVAFGLGLGITQIFDAFASQMEGILKAAPLIIGFTAIAIFALFGYLGGKAQTWAIIAGMALYLLDALLLLLLMALGGGLPIISLVIHGLGLYYLFNGLSACRRLNALEAERGAPVPPPPAFGG
jgi:hypothetical protein